LTPARYLSHVQLVTMTLTRLPAGHIKGDVPPLSEAVWAFPLIGAAIGGIAGCVFWLATLLNLPPLACAFLAIAATALTTGGLHEDGLADVADGFGGGQTKDKKLEIMRDSRLGSYGALALILVIGITGSAMAQSGTMLAFIAIAALSRTAMLLPLTLLPPARKDGLGAAAKSSINGSFWIAMLSSLVLAIIALPLWGPVITGLATLSIMTLATRQIGGQTGDVLGATQKIVECSLWLTVATSVQS